METAALMIEVIFWGALSLLVYTYIVYPAVAVLIGAGPLEKANDVLPPISVLVPAHNEGSVIATKIANFRDLDYPADRIELVIVDDGSTDGTVEAIRSECRSGGLTAESPAPATLREGEKGRSLNGQGMDLEGAALGDIRVRLVQTERRGGKAAAMNRLAQEAQYPYLLFSDANVMFAPSALRRLVDHLASEGVGAVTGEVRLVDSDKEFSAGEQLYYWFERRIQGAESRLGSVMGVDGGMYVIRRDLFPELPEDTILDDFTVSIQVMRSGHRVVYESAAKARESGTPSAAQEFARRIRIAAGAVQLLKRGIVPRWTQPVLWLQFVSHKLLRWGSPLLLAALLVTNLVLISQSILYQTFFAAQLVSGIAMLATWLIPRLRQTVPGAVLFYFGISQFAMGWGIVRGLFDRQPARWERGKRAENQSQPHASRH